MRIAGHANDRGRVYQQVEGLQFNFDKAFFGPSGNHPEEERVDVDRWPLARELDPLELGVHRAALERGNAVPPYVPRDIDDRLQEQIRAAEGSGGLLLLLGDSTAGKTRAAYEAMVATVPNRRVFVPRDQFELRHVLSASDEGVEPYLIWLDDFERYVGPGGMTTENLADLRKSRAIALATLRAEQYRRLNADGSKQSGPQGSIERLLNQIEPILMHRRWTEAEIVRAGDLETDGRISAALKHKNFYGLAEYLAAGPSLLREWKLAWDVGANPRGAALVGAAVDLARAGISGAVPFTVLEKVHRHYLDAAGGPLLRPESMEAALSWAVRRYSGVASLLLPGTEPDTYRAFDYLPEAVNRDNSFAPVPDWLWDVATEQAESDSATLLGVGLAAAHSRPDASIEILKRAATGGSAEAAIYIARVLDTEDTKHEAEYWYRHAAEQGELRAIQSLARMLENQGNKAEALRWWKEAAEANDSHAAYHAGYLSESLGLRTQAKAFFESALAGTEEQAGPPLAALLMDLKQYEEAEKLLVEAYESGTRRAARSLAILYAKTDREDKAEGLFRYCLEKEPSTSSNFDLALLLDKLNRTQEAEEYYSRAINDDYTAAIFNQAMLFRRTGRKAESEAYIRRAAEAGSGQGMLALGIRLMEDNLPGEAEPWLRKAVMAGESPLPWMHLVVTRGERGAEIEDLLETAAKAGSINATLSLGQRKADSGDFEAAEKHLRIAVEAGVDSEYARCDLASALENLGRRDEAIQVYRESFASGHAHANCRMGSLLLEDDRLTEAEEAFRSAYAAGHKHAAARLVKYFMDLQRFGDAAFWRRRLEAGRSVGVTKRRPQKAGAKRRKGRKRK